jgi:predicted nicotinamide N-methyase
MTTRGFVSRKLRGTTATNFFGRSACVLSPPPSEPLLLTGDEHYISKDGRSRTVYKLKGHSGNISDCSVLLEETYDIEKASKKISLISEPAAVNDDLSEDRIDLFSFDLQEINNGYKNGAGTGSMTWESSIAMSLYFNQHPNELKGDVIELGSGVGLGAILSKVATELSQEDDISVTCTDVNDDILKMLQHNMDKAAKNVHIKKLDWCDFVTKNDDTNEREKYDTIIASDCAYLKSQVNPLSATISQLLGKESKLHMFAPANRSVVYDLADELRDTKHMNVQVEDMELSKKRIKTEKLSSTFANGSVDGLYDTSRFLHITAWHAKSADQAIARDVECMLCDID